MPNQSALGNLIRSYHLFLQVVFGDSVLLVYGYTRDSKQKLQAQCFYYSGFTRDAVAGHALRGTLLAGVAYARNEENVATL